MKMSWLSKKQTFENFHITNPNGMKQSFPYKYKILYKENVFKN